MAVPCHSCHGQIKSLLEKVGLEDIQVKYLWELVAEALVCDRPSKAFERGRGV